MKHTHLALVSYAALPDCEVDDRPLHAALRARGARVEIPDWSDPAVDWSAFDAVLIRTPWNYHSHHDAFVRWAEAVEQQTRLLNPAAVVRWNTHKRYLRDLEAVGVPVAPTVWIAPGEAIDVAAVMAERGWTHAFLKPQVGLAASDTLRFTDPAAGQAHLAALPDTAMMLQPYLRRVETDGEVSALLIDGVLTHAVQKRPVPGDYRVQDDHGGTDAPYTFSAEGQAVVAQIVAALARVPVLRDHLPLLYGRIDLLWDDAGRLCLNELEVVEPSLFFRHAPHAAEVLADALLRRCESP